MEIEEAERSRRLERQTQRRESEAEKSVRQHDYALSRFDLRSTLDLYSLCT